MQFPTFRCSLSSIRPVRMEMALGKMDSLKNYLPGGKNVSNLSGSWATSESSTSISHKAVEQRLTATSIKKVWQKAVVQITEPRPALICCQKFLSVVALQMQTNQMERQAQLMRVIVHVIQHWNSQRSDRVMPDKLDGVSMAAAIWVCFMGMPAAVMNERAMSKKSRIQCNREKVVRFSDSKPHRRHLKCVERQFHRALWNEPDKVVGKGYLV